MSVKVACLRDALGHHLEKIENEELVDFIEYCVSQACGNSFFASPSSSTGKHHSGEEITFLELKNGRTGLLWDQVSSVMDVKSYGGQISHLDKVLSLIPGAANRRGFLNQDQLDAARGAGFLHDIKKLHWEDTNDDPSEDLPISRIIDGEKKIWVTDDEHARKGAEFIDECFMKWPNDNYLSIVHMIRPIILATRYHYGRWGDDPGYIESANRIIEVVREADYYASRSD